MLSRSALRAIVDGRQSAHPRIPAVLEERAMPMIARILTSLQTLPSTVFIFFIFWFTLATLPILVFIFLEQMHGEWPLIPHVPHLLFSDVFSFAFSGPIAGIAPSFSSRCRGGPAILMSNVKSNRCHTDHSPASL
jgi:hypothetical protein